MLLFREVHLKDCEDSIKTKSYYAQHIVCIIICPLFEYLPFLHLFIALCVYATCVIYEYNLYVFVCKCSTNPDLKICVQNSATLFQLMDLFMAPTLTKNIYKDHSFFANKTWKGFGGQVKEDKSRI